MDFSLLSPLEFFVDSKCRWTSSLRYHFFPFFLQLIAPDDNSATEVISGVTDLFPAGRNVIVGVKVIPLFVDHLPLVFRIASICILIPPAQCYPSSTGPLVSLPGIFSASIAIVVWIHIVVQVRTAKLFFKYFFMSFPPYKLYSFVLLYYTRIASSYRKGFLVWKMKKYC